MDSNKIKKIGPVGLIVVAFIVVLLVLKGCGNNGLTVWYTDDMLTPYLEEVSKKYGESTNTKVTPVLIKEAQYYEKIRDTKSKGPDLFIGTNSAMEKIYAYGIADKNSDKNVLNEENYPKAAIDAATYGNKTYGYPLYFWTSVLYYNKQYTDNVPKSIEQLRNFFEEDDSEFKGDYVLEFDVSDIMQTYSFIGDTDTANFKDEKFLKHIGLYKGLKEFIEIDAQKTDSDSILENFAGEETLYTIASSDMSFTLKNRNLEWEFGMGVVPGLNEECVSKPLSVTGMIFVNSNSSNQKKAKDFATKLSQEYLDEIFVSLRKYPAHYYNEQNADIKAVYDNYNNSVGLSKEVEDRDNLIRLENILKDVWSNGDIDIEDILSQYE